MGPSPHLWFLDAKQRLLDQNNKYLWVPDLPVVLCIQSSVISSRNSILYGYQPTSVVFACKTATFGKKITSLYGAQTSPVVLCMQNSVIWTIMTSQYVFQPSSVVSLANKTATLGPDIKVCMGPRPHLWFWAHITACLAQEYQDYMGSSPHLWLCAYKTASLGAELQVSVGSSPHLWLCAYKTASLGAELPVSVGPRSHLCFFQAKQRLLDQNYKSLLVPDMTCRVVHVQQRD